jgi:hypothetical protein
MDKKIISIAQTFISLKVDKERYLENFYHILNGFDKESSTKLLKLIKVLNFFSILRYFKPICSISESGRNHLLNLFYNAPIGKLRGGINGLRSLCLLSFYSMDENQHMIGIRKS